MPIYVYKCTTCSEEQELWLDAPPPEVVTGGVCAETSFGDACQMKRRYTAPSLGYMEGGGFSPSRGPGK